MERHLRRYVQNEMTNLSWHLLADGAFDFAEIVRCRQRTYVAPYDISAKSPEAVLYSK